MTLINRPIGIIAEDNSDISSVICLIKKIRGTKKILSHSFIGKGCGKLKKKCFAWANVLHLKGCKTLIVVHDLDRAKLNELTNFLNESLKDNPIKKYVISIPIEEIEAWILSDPDSIKKYFNITKRISFKGNPETIKSPKEKIQSEVWIKSQKKVEYLNTKHNEKIFELIDINKILTKCVQFNIFYDFVMKI